MTVTELLIPDTSLQERELREDLAACYRIFANLGWVELIYNHITLRVPGPDHHFLINPFGLMYTEVTASNLVKSDLSGNIIRSSSYPINKAGFVLHSAIHAHIPQAKCIMHTHTTAGMAVACKKDGLATTNFYAAQLYDQIAYHEFEGITVNPEEQKRVLAVSSSFATTDCWFGGKPFPKRSPECGRSTALARYSWRLSPLPATTIRSARKCASRLAARRSSSSPSMARDATSSMP